MKDREACRLSSAYAADLRWQVVPGFLGRFLDLLGLPGPGTMPVAVSSTDDRMVSDRIEWAIESKRAIVLAENGFAIEVWGWARTLEGFSVRRIRMVRVGRVRRWAVDLVAHVPEAITKGRFHNGQVRKTGSMRA